LPEEVAPLALKLLMTALTDFGAGLPWKTYPTIR